MRRPSRRTSPEKQGSVPEITRSVVVLPAPLGPRRATPVPSGPAQLYEAQDAGGQIPGHLVASPVEPDTLEGGLDPLDDLGLVGVPKLEGAAEHPGGMGRLRRHLQVLEDGHPREGLETLERAP